MPPQASCNPAHQWRLRVAHKSSLSLTLQRHFDRCEGTGHSGYQSCFHELQLRTCTVPNIWKLSIELIVSNYNLGVHTTISMSGVCYRGMEHKTFTRAIWLTRKMRSNEKQRHSFELQHDCSSTFLAAHHTAETTNPHFINSCSCFWQASSVSVEHPWSHHCN